MYIPICAFVLFYASPLYPPLTFRRMNVLALTTGFTMANEATVPTPHYPTDSDMDSEIIQDLLPGMPGAGSIGSVPQHHVRALPYTSFVHCTNICIGLQTGCDKTGTEGVLRGSSASEEVWYVT